MKCVYAAEPRVDRMSSPARGMWIEIVLVIAVDASSSVIPRTGDVD